MVLRVKLDTHTWIAQDYTDENSLSITGTIYSDDALSSVFDFTGYTPSFRLKSQGKIVFDTDTDNSVSAINSTLGTFRYKPEVGDLLVEMNGEVSILLEKSGTEITAIGINGSSDLHVRLA